MTLKRGVLPILLKTNCGREGISFNYFLNQLQGRVKKRKEQMAKGQKKQEGKNTKRKRAKMTRIDKTTNENN